MNIVNPFLGVYIPDLNDTTKRKSIPIETIQKIQDKCVSTDDELRWMIGIISDTGMRLAEAVGLIRKDIVLNCDIPHVIIRPNEKRRLKTKQSERILSATKFTSDATPTENALLPGFGDFRNIF